MAKFEIVDVEVSPEVELFRALKECGVRYPRMRDLRVLVQTLVRLTEPPKSLQIPTTVRTGQANLLRNQIVPLEGDMAARILKFDDRQPNPDVKWGTLSRSDRKRARRTWTWALDAGLDTSPQGRPRKIDPALVLYCAHVVAEGCGEPRCTISKPPAGGAPGGPMWRALMAGLPLAQSFLACIDGSQCKPQGISNAETIVDILKTARSKKFEACCRKLAIGSHAEDVAEHPATFRLALARARALRNRTRRK
jgi:hypothetical protein